MKKEEINKMLEIERQAHEELARQLEYIGREETRVFNPDTPTPNGKFMMKVFADFTANSLPNTHETETETETKKEDSA